MDSNTQFCFERREKKYILTPEQHEALLAGMAPRLRADGYGRYTICSIYCDTDDFRLIRTSLEKPVYKEKLRLRSYSVPDSRDGVFVELKKKFRGVVYKRRTLLPAAEAAECLRRGAMPEGGDQICREIDWFLRCRRLSPKAFIACDRTAFAGLEDPGLRVTFDTGLRWRDDALDLRAGDFGEPLTAPRQVLMEVKLPGAAPLWLARLLSETGARPASFSKYGTCYTRGILGRGRSGESGKGAAVCA